MIIIKILIIGETNMISLKEYINESSEQVFAVQDNTGAILNVFQTKSEAEKNAKTWPKESEAKVVVMKKNHVEN